MITLFTVVPIGLLILLAGVTQGLTGFGFGIISVSILLLFFSPKIVIPTMLLLGTLLSIMVTIEAREHIEAKRVIPLIVSGVMGMPLGTYLLKILDAYMLKVAVGVVIIATASALLVGYRLTIRNENLALPPVGLLSGFLNGMMSLSGPPVILFLTNQGVEKNRFRANIIAYFVVLNIMTALSHALGGLITATVIKSVLILMPAMLVGGWLGIRLTGRVNAALFRIISLLLVTAAGLFLIGSEVVW